MIKEFEPEQRLGSRGIQSEIYVGHYKGELAILKISGQGLSRHNLESLYKALPKYRDEMQRAGVTIPENLSTEIEDKHIEIVDKFVWGETIDHLAMGGHVGAEWSRMVAMIADAPTRKVFMDAKPANFIDANGWQFYVDTFPPMLRDLRGLIKPWIPEVFKRDRQMMTFNFGDIRGRITKLLSLSKLEYPNVYGEVVQHTLDAVQPRIDPRDFEYIVKQEENGFPHMREFYSGDPQRLRKAITEIYE